MEYLPFNAYCSDFYFRSDRIAAARALASGGTLYDSLIFLTAVLIVKSSSLELRINSSVFSAYSTQQTDIAHATASFA